MNSAADMRRFHEQTALQKAKDKVIDALKNDPLGLSANQLMTVCRLSIKTVKNILATIDVQEEHGVYFLSDVAKAEISTEPQAEQVTPVVQGKVHDAIKDLKLEGDAKDIAEQIFQQLVAKVYEDIKSKDAGKASEFAFCMAGNAIGCLFSVTKPTKIQEVKSLVLQCTDHMAVQAMQNRKIKFS